MTPALILGVGAAVVAALVVLALVLASRRDRRSRLHLEQQLAGSRREMDQLVEQVEHLAAEVADRSRRAADDHEYVITTLTEAAQVTGRSADDLRTLGRSGAAPDPVVSASRALEEQAVARLSTLDTSTRLGVLLTSGGVKAVALGHGLRRALTRDNIDRAAAEAHVARRRSRRTRRQELREARRLLRAMRAQQLEAATAGRARDAEDAA